MANETGEQSKMQDPESGSLSTHESFHDDNISANEFEVLTTITQDTPYHPESWLRRAEFFIRSDYYEPASADAYKAHTLCDDYVRLMLPANSKVPAIAGDILDGLRERAACFIYVTLRELGTMTAATKYRNRFPMSLLSTSRLPTGIDRDTWSTKNKPKLKRHEYPWLSQRTQPRDVQHCQHDLAEDGLRIDKASFTDDDTIYGLFTNELIPAEEAILVDKVTKLKIRKELKAKEEHASMLLLQRMLFFAVDRASKDLADGFDILAMQPTKTLTVTYDVPSDDFSFTKLIQQVATFLFKKEKLFCPDFDFWRIFTLYWRLGTNCFEHLPPDPAHKANLQTITGTAPLYSFCNHSCKTNARWEPINREGGPNGAMLI
jgi:hypothetical protein